MGSYEEEQEKRFARVWRMLEHLEARVTYPWNRKPRRDACGARTRGGLPCRARGLGGGGRCKNHGGASTGPQSQEGKARIAAAQRARWAAWRAQHGR
jgi:hypothetical protein